MTESTPQPPHTLADRVAEQIHRNRVHMRPRAYFVAGSVALGLGIASATIVAIFFTSVVIFRFRVHAPFGYLRHDAGGLTPFLQNLPWIPIVIAVLGIVGGIWLIRRTDVRAHHTFLAVMLTFLATMTAAGFAIDALGVPNRALDAPPLRPFVEQPLSGDSWVAGLTTDIADDVIVISNPRDGTINIIVTPSTRFIPPSHVTSGEFVRVLGDRESPEQFTAEILMHGQQPRGFERRLYLLPYEFQKEGLDPRL